MSTLSARVDVAVIGAGQAGLTMSWHLREAGREHVLLERRSSLGGGWQDRWDEFRLVSPNWTASFPDAPYDGEDPDAYMLRDELIGRVARYASTIDAPVTLEAGVDQLRQAPDGSFELETPRGRLVAREVVVATGGFHLPHVPSIAGGLSSRVLSVHSRDYRREPDLPPGGVLVVGSGQTGVQLVEELRAAGREVYLSVGTAGQAPRQYRGRDLFFWLWQMAERGEEVGIGLPTVDQLPDPRRRLSGNPQLSGHGGGHDIDLRQMGRDGIVLLGRLAAIDGERVRFAPDVHDNLALVDRSFDERLRRPIDGFIAAARFDCAPAHERPVTDFEPPTIEELDLAGSGIATVLWSTGYRPDLGWVDLPITDEMGFPRQVRGVTEVPGLYFLGSLWQHDQTSATLFGMPRDARVLAARMASQPIRVRRGA